MKTKLLMFVTGFLFIVGSAFAQMGGGNMGPGGGIWAPEWVLGQAIWVVVWVPV